MKAGDPFSSVAANVPQIVALTVEKVTAAVKANYADSYPASLFKNLGKCRLLADSVA